MPPVVEIPVDGVSPDMDKVIAVIEDAKAKCFKKITDFGFSIILFFTDFGTTQKITVEEFAVAFKHPMENLVNFFNNMEELLEESGMKNVNTALIQSFVTTEQIYLTSVFHVLATKFVDATKLSEDNDKFSGKYQNLITEYLANLSDSLIFSLLVDLGKLYSQ